MQKYQVKVLVCAVQRGNQVYIPNGNFTFKEGDKVSITAKPSEILLFFAAIGVPRQKIKNVMLVGGSNISYEIITDSNGDKKVIISGADINSREDFIAYLKFTNSSLFFNTSSASIPS